MGCETGDNRPVKKQCSTSLALIEQLGYDRQELEETCFKSSENQRKQVNYCFSNYCTFL